MKEEHERRIRLASGIQPDRASASFVSEPTSAEMTRLWQERIYLRPALPERSPASFETIDLEMLGLSLDDADEQYWQVQQTNLQRLFAHKNSWIERQIRMQAFSRLRLSLSP